LALDPAVISETLIVLSSDVLGVKLGDQSILCGASKASPTNIDEGTLSLSSTTEKRFPTTAGSKNNGGLLNWGVNQFG
jgi:hypothetical protein